MVYLPPTFTVYKVNKTTCYPSIGIFKFCFFNDWLELFQTAGCKRKDVFMFTDNQLTCMPAFSSAFSMFKHSFRMQVCSASGTLVIS